MAVSMDTTKVRVLGPAILLKEDSTKLGHTTDDGVEVTHAATFQDVMVDVYGDTVINKYLIGESIQATATFAQFETEAISQLIPFSTYSGSGSPPLQVGTDMGRSGLAQAFKLTIRPYQNHDESTPTETEDITIYKALPVDEIVIPVKFKEQAKLPVTFMGLPDFSNSVGNLLWGVGANA